ncbi:hypothetical protein [Hephaestia mangrovi]|uniref:hypothetical protein n=1 Tax=Hephaestia mangrovi TaxID=2873268 RepID=UPI001CA6ED9A|nr:hypothetical protein [Hephaestia mangrovi]MBY8829423.1 hypothetical protein [Hephaestia mangrovi]
MFRSLTAIALLTLPAVASAQTTPAAKPAPSSNTRTLAQAEATAPDGEKKPDEGTLAASNSLPQKVRSVTVTGDKPCPKSTGDEIVVCSRADADEQYRIPPKFRELPHPAANNSWTNRAAVIDQVSREAGNLPNTCSVNGSGGQTGCSWQALQQWQAEMRAKKRAEESVP